MTTDILTRLREAEGPDRELDALIQIATMPDYGAYMDMKPSRYVRFEDVWLKNRADHINHANNVSDWWKVPNYTASVDASLALVERMLPGCAWEITTTGFKPGASIVVHGPRTMFGAYANTPALALIATLFTALQEKENTNGN